LQRYFFIVPLVDPDVPEPLVLLFIISGCSFIIAMHLLFFCMALCDMPWHFFIMAMSPFDMFEFSMSLAAYAVPAANVSSIAIANFFIWYSLLRMDFR